MTALLSGDILPHTRRADLPSRAAEKAARGLDSNTSMPGAVCGEEVLIPAAGTGLGLGTNLASLDTLDRIILDDSVEHSQTSLCVW